MGWHEFDYEGETVRYRDSVREVARRWLAGLIVCGVACVPILAAAGVTPRWFWIFF